MSAFAHGPRKFLALVLLCAAAVVAPAQHSVQRQPDQREDRHAATVAPLEDAEDSIQNLFRREQWFNDQRRYPLRHIPEGARRRALEQMRAMVKANHDRARAGLRDTALNSALTSLPWTQIGPQPANFFGLSSGRATALAIDPRDKNVVYLGTAGGGVWKTINAGSTWTPLTDSQPSLAVGAVALDPSNPDIVYVGTGEQNFGGDNYYGEGILKSIDGGASWTHILGPFGNSNIGAIAVSPANSNIVLASALAFTSTLPWGGALMRSTDGGATWTPVISGMSTAVVFDPTNGNIAYAGLGTYGDAYSGIYKSTDAGRTWNKLPSASGLPANSGRIGLAHASSSGVVFAAVADVLGATGTTISGIYRSSNAGASWTRIYGSAASYPSCCTWYENGVAVDPVDGSVIATGGYGAVLTKDGGASWNTFSGGHADYHAFAFTPDGSRLYAANDGGVWAIDLPATTLNWIGLNSTIATITFYPGIGLDDHNFSRLFAGTQDNGALLYQGSLTWNYLNCGDASSAQIDPSLSNTMYSYCIGQIFKTTNAQNFSVAMSGIDTTNDAGPWVAPLVISAANPQTLYYGAKHVYQSVDSASTWTAISPLFTTAAQITSIGTAASNPDVVYAGTGNGHIYVTSNATAGAAASWSLISSGLPSASVTQVAVDRSNPSLAYAAFSGFGTWHVFKTVDRGAHWTNATGNLPLIPVNDIVVDPDIAGTLYVATDLGAFFSTDDGSTWNVLGNGMPNVVVQSLSLQRSSRMMFAITHGRSSWSLLLPTAASSITVTAPNGGESWQVGTQQTIQWTYTALGGNVNIVLQKAGADYRALASVPIDSGSYSWTLPLDLPAGNDYSIRISAASSSVYADSSNANFTITATPWITITSPNSVQVWLNSSTQTIKWNYFNLTGQAEITLLKGGALFRTIAGTPLSSAGTGSVATGSVIWSLPADLPLSNDYQVRVTCGSTTDTSPNFANASIVLGFPRANEYHPRGSTTSIEWQSQGLTGNADISLLKGGVFYRAIDTVAIDSLQINWYSWTVPIDLPFDTDYSILVRSSSAPAIFGVTAGTFSTTPYVSATTLSAGLTSTFGTPVQFTAIVGGNGPTPTGNVLFVDNDINTALAFSTLDASGFATFTTSGLSLGRHSLRASYQGDAVYPAVTSPNFIHTVLTNNTQFVQRVFRDLLDRAVDSSGLAYYVAQLNNGLLRKDFVAAIMQSGEFRNREKFVAQAYVAVFQREADYGGFRYYATQIINGLTQQQMVDQFTGSTEFQIRYGTLNDTDFITQMYVAILLRNPDPGGLAYYQNQLATGKLTRSQMVLDFMSSNEFQTNAAIQNRIFVSLVYFTLLDRDADQGGYAYYDQQVDNGLLPTEMISQFLNSTEYSDRTD